MPISVDLHDVTSIRATAHRGPSSQWLGLEFSFHWPSALRPEPPFEITVFMTNYETAKLYAEAINKAELVELPAAPAAE